MEGLARILLTLLAIAIAVRFIDDGPAGVKKWMGAKFLGKAS